MEAQILVEFPVLSLPPPHYQDIYKAHNYSFWVKKKHTRL